MDIDQSLVMMRDGYRPKPSDASKVPPEGTRGVPPKGQSCLALFRHVSAAKARARLAQEHNMDEIKTNAHRLLVAHGFIDIAETVDALESPHEIRLLAVKRCVIGTIDVAKVSNNPSYAAGMFDLLVVQLDAARVTVVEHYEA